MAMRFRAEEYCDDVLSGEIVAGRWTKLACERHRRDLETGSERGLFFDVKAAKFAVAFFHLLPLWEGEWAGRPLRLEPAQQFWIWSLFGWKREDGTRRFRTGYLEVGRKNAKTTLAAGIGLYMGFYDGEAGAQVFSVATKRDQALIVHNCATQMVKSSPVLGQDIGIFRNNLHSLKTASKFEPLSSDYNKLDGLNLHCGIADELHAWPARELWGVLKTSMGARRQPLLLGITTAGTDRQSVCYVQREYLTKILLGQVEDDSFWGMIYTLDMKLDWPDLPEDDDWEDERNWLKANPLLGVSKKVETMRSEALEAANKPSELNGFLRWNLNVWTTATERWISPVHWAACGERPLPDLTGRRCYAGLDLSSTQDITALVLVFPPFRTIQEPYWVMPFFWCPEDAILERSKQDRVPYDAWVREGLLTATPGNIIDYSFVMERLKQCVADYDLGELAYDRWGSQKIVADMQDAGFEIDQKAAEMYGKPLLVQFGQGYASMSGPMKELGRLVVAEELGHGGHQVLTWMADNVVATMDPAGNIKPDKGKSREKIDGITATIMGLARALVHRGPGASVYEERGIRTI